MYVLKKQKGGGVGRCKRVVGLKANNWMLRVKYIYRCITQIVVGRPFMQMGKKKCMVYTTPIENIFK